MVTHRGAEAAVRVPAAQWRQTQAAARLSLKELLLCADARSDCLVPDRTQLCGKTRRRRVKPLA